MKEFVLKHAYAKLNLTLSVVSKRADGYHELDGVMCETDLCDDVRIQRAEDISVKCDAAIPADNTAVRAAKAFFALTKHGAHIEIVKRVPSEAGLGGASADAAAVLQGLCELYDVYIGREKLLEIGKEIGADVPFSLTGGFCRARGIGEILTPISPMRLDVLIAKPKAGVSTAALFKSLTPPYALADTDGAICAIERGDRAELSRLAQNALYAPAAQLVPEIGEYVSRMKEHGAVGASMTGSGSAVFGIFESEESCALARGAFSDAAFARVCRTGVENV